MAAAGIIDEAYRRHDGGDSAQALLLLGEALHAAPQDADLLFARGNVRRESGNLEGAQADFTAVLALCPDHAKAHNNLGVTLQAQGRLHEAQQQFEQALARDARFADAAFNLGNVLHAQGQQEPALAWLERVTAWRPQFAAAWMHLGQVLSDLGRLNEAADAMRSALAADPAHAGAHNDFGLILAELNRIAEGVAALEQAVGLAPDSDQYKTNLALLLMQMGQIRRAWELYEHRWVENGVRRPAYRYDPALEWHGGSLAGRRLRIWWEQGLGDTLCFSRFLGQVADTFGPASVSMEVQPGMRKLLAHSLPGVDIIEQGEAGGSWDLHVPIMSLPERCGITASNLPVATPYLSATPAAVERWGARLAQVPGPRVGVCWGAGLWATGAGLERRFRSVDPASFEQLLEVPKAAFISLQKGARAEHAQRWAQRPGFFDWTGEIADFDDTAALISGLDLVITVDTSVMHLAAALDKPTWVPLRFEGGNLWPAEGEFSLWYPKLRIFRQTRQAQWGDVMQRVTRALREYVAGRAAEGGA